MRISILFAAASALALAGCGGEATSVDPNDPEAMAEAADALPKPQAGEYTTTGELVEFNVPGIPEEQAAAGRQAMEQQFAAASSFCITQEQADRGFEDFVREMQGNDQDCTISNFVAGSASIDATMTCGGGDGGMPESTIRIAGTVGETEQDMTMTMDVQNPVAPDGGAMHMVVRTHAERTGDCAANSGAG